MSGQVMNRRDYLKTTAGAAVGLLAGIGIGYMAPRVPTTPSSKKVLLIFSYHPEYSWVVEETSGLQEVFWERGLKIEKFYMDTKRNTTAEWIDKVSAQAMRRIDEFSPDIVMVFDDNACQHVAMKYAGRNLPFVFCGMNRDPSEYGFPTDNITGVVERHHIKETVDLLRRLAPNVRRIGMLTDDSLTSQGFIAQLRDTDLPVQVADIHLTDDFDAWKTRVKALQSSVDAIGLFQYHTLTRTGEDISVPSDQVLEWTLENSNLREFAFFDFTIDGGALCGVIASGYEQGKAAAEIAVKILDGTEPSDIPIESPRKGVPMINLRRSIQMGITIPDDLEEPVRIV